MSDAKYGLFGPIFYQYKHKAALAIKKLTGLRDGEAREASYHQQIGYIDLVWGKEGTNKSNGYGLAKIARYHPEVLQNMQQVFNELKVYHETQNRFQLRSDKYEAAVSKIWFENEKIWLLTVFEKRTG
jgi:hypothetical protein